MTDSAQHPDAQLRRALEDAAPDLGLELEDEHAKKLTVGAMIPAAYSTVDADASAQPVSAGEDDDAAIRDLIERWESTEHDDVHQVTETITTDPYFIVSPSGSELVDSEGLKEWTDSRAYQDQSSSFQRHADGERKVSDVAVAYVGPHLASCTYRMEEQGQDGVYVANTAVICRKGENGWRIVVVTKHATIRSDA